MVKNVVTIVIAIITELVPGFENDLRKSFINVLFDSIVITIDSDLEYIMLNKIIVYEKFVIVD